MNDPSQITPSNAASPGTPPDPEAVAGRYASVLRPGLFSGQTILVTGGGSGIGRCIAHELASLGAKPVLIGRKLEKLERVKAEIEHDGGVADLEAFDIRDEAAVKDGIASVVARNGAIQGLVNNAGGQFPAPVQAITGKGFETVVRTNLLGTFLMSREAFNQSMAKTGGAIVNIVADFWNGMPGMAHSGAARAGVVNLTQTMAVELAPSGLRVNAVAPGWIASSGLDTYDASVKAMIPMLAKAVPLKRLGMEAEVSGAVCFLLSPAASFITGATLKIDGAASIAPHVWPMQEHTKSAPFDGFHRAVLPEVLRKG
jgi:citronellol/citronellal dehydrogenase